MHQLPLKFSKVASSIILISFIVLSTTGAASAAAALCTSPTEVEFTTTFSKLTITNAGDQPISITNLAFREDTNKFSINPQSISNSTQLTLPLTLAPSAKLDLQLGFFPGATRPPLYSVLEITTDSEEVGKISVVLRGLQRPSNMKIDAVNVDAYDFTNGLWRPGFFNDFMVFGKIRDGLFVDGFTFSQSDTAVLRLFNRDTTTPVQVTNMTLSNTMWAIVNSEKSLTLPPGQSADVTLQYVSREGGKGAREAQLRILTDDPAAPQLDITLSCGYMEYREDTNEMSLPTIISVFGYNINIYNKLTSGFMALPWLRTSKLVGEEVRSMIWQRADLTKPVYARSIAAFLLVIYKAPEAETLLFHPDQGVVAIDPKYGQALLPRALGKDVPAEGYFNTTIPFSMIVSHKFETTGMVWSTNHTKDLNVHLFPLRDRSSRITPDAYLLAHDFILPRGCCSGPGCANCDYQDNIYVVSNIKPADSDALLPPAYKLGSPELILSFDKAVTGTLADSGFTHTQRNDEDVMPGSNSFVPGLIALDAAGKKLSVTSALGSNRGAINRQVNGLSVWYDAEDDPYYVLARIEGPLTTMTRVGEEACVWVGSDKDNYAKLCATYDETFAHALLFMSETDGVPSPPTLQKLDGIDSIRALDLFLLVTPHSRVIVPAFSVNGNPMTSVGNGIAIRERLSGLFFGPRIHAGILTAHSGGGTGFKTNFLRFSVTPDLGGAELKRLRTHALGVRGQNVQRCAALEAPPTTPITTTPPGPDIFAPATDRAPTPLSNPTAANTPSSAVSVSYSFFSIVIILLSGSLLL